VTGEGGEEEEDNEGEAGYDTIRKEDDDFVTKMDQFFNDD